MPEEVTQESSSKTLGNLPERKNIEELERALSEEKKVADDYLNRLKYLQSDFENYKRRISREMPLMSEKGVKQLTTELLVVLDELDCALTAEQ